ncbi:MAG: TIGR02996 domain-containing protein [Myxococcota bacterium]
MSDWFTRVIRRTPAPLPPDATREGLLAEVIARPDDDAPRWVVADLYGQQGDPRGELIAVQLTLAALTDSDPERREALEAREKALLDRHKPEWVGRFKGARTEYGIEGKQTFVKGNPTFWTFERGFVHSVKMAAMDFVPNAAELLTTEPVVRVELTQARGRMTAFLESCPELERVRTLDLGRNTLTDDDLRALFTTDRLASLESLNLTLVRIGARRGAALFGEATARFPKLRELLLWGTELGDPGVVALSQCAFLETVETLALGSCKIGTKGAEALLASGHLGALRDLRVPGNRLTDHDEARLVERFGDVQL